MLTACQISVSLLFLNWIKNEMIFDGIAELMLPTLIFVQGNIDPCLKTFKILTLNIHFVVINFSWDTNHWSAFNMQLKWLWCFLSWNRN